MDFDFTKLIERTKDPAYKLPGSTPTGCEASWVVQHTARLERVPLVFAREHVFADPVSLADWLKRNCEPRNAEILVDEEQVTATSGGRDVDADVVSVALTRHPTWARWLAGARTMDQKMFHRLLRGAKTDLRPKDVPAADDDTKLYPGESLLEKLGTIKVGGETSYQREIDARGVTTLRSADQKQTVDCKLPDEFHIYVPMYVGVRVAGVEPVYKVRVLVEIDIIQGQPVFKLEFPDLALTMLDARHDVAACLAEQLGSEWVVGLGRFGRSLRAQQPGLDGLAIAKLAVDPQSTEDAPHDEP